MKVPKYQQQIGIETARTRPARMPQVSMPKATPGAFGADVARATQSLGRVGEKIAEHLADMERERQDIEVRRRETAYMRDWQNRLSSQEEETVVVGDKEITRPKGLLLRKLETAEGATLEANKIYQDTLKPSLDGLSQYQVNKLEPFINRYFLTVQRKVIAHEANQLDAKNKNETDANLELRRQEAALIRDKQQLADAIDGAIEAAAPYYKKYDEATRKVLNEKIASDMVETTAISALNSSGDLALSQALLDSAKDKISLSTYNDIKSTLAKGYKSMKAELENIRKEKRILDRFDLISKIANGELDWTNSSEIIRDTADKDTRLAEAMVAAVKRVDYEPKTENQDFMELAENMFSSPDAEKISDFLVDALSNKNISKDKLAVLVFTAKARADELKNGETNGFFKRVFDVIKMSSFGLSGAARILINTVKKMQEKKVEGEQVVDIAKEEIKKQIKKDEPSLLMKDDIPNDIYSKDTGVKEVYKGDTELKPDYKFREEPTTEDYTQEDLEWTANKYGISVEEVKKRLGIE